MSDAIDRIAAYWDVDSATYDNSASHHPRTGIEIAAWSGVLERLLPARPARVIDVGAGTGFLSLLAARLGYEVTAVDVAAGMLARLRANAAERGLSVDTVHSRADELPSGQWHAVISRHLVWTLPDPVAALRCWNAAAPAGRLVLLESAWGDGADSLARIAGRARTGLRRLRRIPPDHHGPYEPAMLSALPYPNGIAPEQLLDLVTEAGWHSPRLHRLVDVEWAARRLLPLPDRLLGVVPRYAIIADGALPAPERMTDSRQDPSTTKE
jgi:SAM-dependent methyltransferase